MNSTNLVRPLFNGPIDIVGDIHGEIDALRDLLGHLGYSDEGTHSKGRRLVFLGDLTDRGPDSPSVVRRVARLVDSGRAQWIIGNHELNILRGEKKEGNGWFYGEDDPDDESEKAAPQKPADAKTRAETIDLFRRLPIALEREGVRVVQACWDQAAIALIRDETSVEDMFKQHKTRRMTWSAGASRIGFKGDSRTRTRIRSTC
jgi:hypothetical protein